VEDTGRMAELQGDFRRPGMLQRLLPLRRSLLLHHAERRLQCQLHVLQLPTDGQWLRGYELGPSHGRCFRLL